MAFTIKKDVPDEEQKRYNFLTAYLDGLCNDKKAFLFQSRCDPYCVKHETFVTYRVYLYRGCKVSIVNGPGADSLIRIKSNNKILSRDTLNELERILSQT